MTEEETVTSADMMEVVNKADDAVFRMQMILREQGTRSEFLHLIGLVEQYWASLRELVILHSRSSGKGIRGDGKPDRRFRKQRGSQK